MTKRNSFFVDFRENNIIYSDAVVWTNLRIHYPKKGKLEIGKVYAMDLITLRWQKINILRGNMISQQVQLAFMNILIQPHLGHI